MTLFANDFEQGVNGNTPTTSDTGSPSQFSSVTVSAGSSIKYDTTHVAHGTMALKMVVADVLATNIQGATGTLTEEWGRFYIFPTAFSGQDSLAVNFSGASAKNNILQSGGLKLQVRSNSGGSGATGVSIPTSQWVRVEYHILYSSTVGTMEAKLFNTMDSITADDTTAALTGTNTQSNSTNFGLGTGNTSFHAYTAWYDCWVAGCTAYPGPFPVNTTAPTVSGSAPVGSVLTAGNGIWNSGGTFTYSYQWTTGGSNIGGATSSTYTTVSGDIGNAIGCKVTATGQQATNENATQASSNTITPTGGIFLPSASELRNLSVMRAAVR